MMNLNRLLLGVGLFCGVAAGAGVEVIRDGQAVARIYHAPLGQDAEWTGMKAFERKVSGFRGQGSGWKWDIISWLQLKGKRWQKMDG